MAGETVSFLLIKMALGFRKGSAGFPPATECGCVGGGGLRKSAKSCFSSRLRTICSQQESHIFTGDGDAIKVRSSVPTGADAVGFS